MWPATKTMPSKKNSKQMDSEPKEAIVSAPPNTSPPAVATGRIGSPSAGCPLIISAAGREREVDPALLAELNAEQSEPAKATVSADRQRQIAAAEARLQAVGIL